MPFILTDKKTGRQHISQTIDDVLLKLNQLCEFRQIKKLKEFYSIEDELDEDN